MTMIISVDTPPSLEFSAQLKRVGLNKFYKNGQLKPKYNGKTPKEFSVDIMKHLENEIVKRGKKIKKYRVKMYTKKEIEDVIAYLQTFIIWSTKKFDHLPTTLDKGKVYGRAQEALNKLEDIYGKLGFSQRKWRNSFAKFSVKDIIHTIRKEHLHISEAISHKRDIDTALYAINSYILNSRRIRKAQKIQEQNE